MGFLFGEKAQLSKRWPILFWFGAIFCFILFPAFLIDVGLDSFLLTRKNQQKKVVFKQLNDRLELLMQYRNSRHYYHAVFKKIVELADKSSNPIKYLSKALPHLNKRNPGVFRFVVWDKKGKPVSKLTDEKRYKYIIKTLYKIFKQVSEDCLTSYPGNPIGIEAIDKKLNLMRSYLGAFFVPERLNLPFLQGALGEVIMASSTPEKSHFWFQIRKDFGLFANIDIAAIESSDYLKKIIRSLNNNTTSGLKCGTAELIRNRKVTTDKNIKFKRELLIELGKFGNTSETEVETPNQLLIIKPLTPFTLGFCAIPTRNILTNVSQARRGILIAAIALISVLSAVLIFSILKTGFFSIRWKLALLFIYANGLPLMILGFLGFEYLQQKRTQLLDKAQKQIGELITDMDSKYISILDIYAKKANEACDKINVGYLAGKVTDKMFAEFEASLEKLAPSDIFVVDQNEKFKIFQGNGKKSGKLISSIGKSIIGYVNESKFTPMKLFDKNKQSEANKAANNQAQSLLTGNTIAFDEILQKTRKIESQQIAAEEKLYYWSFLGNMQTRRMKYLTMVSWPHNVLQEVYLKKSMADYNDNSNQIKVYAMVETNGITYPSSGVSPEIQKLFRQVFSLKVLRGASARVNNEDFTAFGSVGKIMNKIALIGIYPLEKIETHIAGIKFRLVIFAFLSLILTSGIGVMLAKQFLVPVKELENGVKAIGEQNFRYRIPIESGDEFGHLGNVFNRAIESLEDLEVARIVQENLFPADAMQHGNLQVYGKSVSMTRLGGDYYDYFPIDEKFAGILMGDVAGHGVPAALLMAMAKASVLLTDAEKKHSPANLLSSLHRVIFKIKSTKIKRMMTCQYFSINSKTGDFKFSNAGHCFPALIKKGSDEVELMHHIGTPLGITKKARYKDDDLKLSDGDTIILYTDGIIETKDANGQELGFDNFKSLIARSRDDNLEKFYHNIFNAYLAWSPSAEDDITMVLIRYQETLTGGPA